MRKYQIRRYFIIFASVIVALLIIIPLITVYMLTGAYDDQIRNDISQTSFSIQKTVSSFVNGLYNLCYELSVNPGILTMDGDVQTPILAGAASRNDYIELLYITALDGMQVARSEGEPGYRGERWWFQRIVENRQPFVSRSYYSLYTNMPCTSVFMALYDGTEKVGVFGADINLKYLQGLAEQFTDLENGRYSFIIDGEGIVIAHHDSLFLETLTDYKSMVRTVARADAYGNNILNPDGSVATEEEEFYIPESYQTVIKAVIGGESGLEIIADGKKTYYISYEPIKLPGYSDSWSVITVQDRDVAMSTMYSLITQVLLIIVLILVILIALILVFYKIMRNAMSSLGEAQNEADNRTRTIVNATPRMCLLFDSDFNLADFNIATTQFMGFTTKEETLTEFVRRLKEYTPDFQSDGQPSVTIIDMLAVVAEKGQAVHETELNMNGALRIVSTDMKKVPYQDSFAIVCFASDITDVRDRERELALVYELNENQLLKLNLVVKATKIGLWEMEVVNNDPVNPVNIITWSDEFRHMLGYTDEDDFPDMIGSLTDALHPKDAEMVPRTVAAHLKDITGRTPYDMEYRLMKKNGEYAYVHATGEVIRDENGNAVYSAGSIRDITETKNLISEIEHRRMEAETANKAKSAFLSTMSHEIRTPMNAILGISEILLQNDALERNIRESLEKIYTSGNMLLGIINDILDLSKIEAGKFELSISNYETASLISDTAQLNMMRIGSKKIEFKLIIEENLPAVLLGDELRVKQILNNLLSNAFKYTSEGAVKMSVSSETNNGNNDEIILVISISDTGQGMTKEQVDKLFDEYTRFNTDANRTTEGTGLGMKITRNLIQMMNGEITIKSEPGTGSDFAVRLPQGRINSEILGKERVENLRQFRTSNTVKMRKMPIAFEPMPYGNILIVDDVETNIYVAKGLMSPYKLKIDSTNKGIDAIKKIKDGSIYDIIFMDHMMPEMDGVEVTKRLRDLGYVKPIVALTANAVAGQADIFLNSGFDDFISKPIDMRQMNAVLNKFVRDMHPLEIAEAARRQAESAKIRSFAGGNAEQSNIAPQLLKIFVNDANKSLGLLEEFIAKGEPYGTDDIQAYVIHTHGMKNALTGIMQVGLAHKAQELEYLGRDNNIGAIKTQTPAFLESLRGLVGELVLKIDEDEQNKDKNLNRGDKSDLQEKFLALKTAFKNYDIGTVDMILEELRKKSWPQPVKEMLGKISEYLLHSDFEKAESLTELYAADLSFWENESGEYAEYGSKTLLADREIAGLDITKGLERYNGDEEIYLKILRAYSTDISSLLGVIETVSEDKLNDYTIKVHGIKGASFDIFAEQIAKEAKALEEAAKNHDIDYIYEHNAPFIEAVRELIENIDNMISAVNAANPKSESKPKKDKIDAESISKLLAACKLYDMNGVMEAMEEIEMYQYESDSDLAEWLLQKVDMIAYAEIIKKFVEK